MSKRIAPSPDAQHSDDGLSSGGYHTQSHVLSSRRQVLIRYFERPKQ